MINRPLISVLLLALAIGIGLFSLNYIERNCTEMIDLLDMTIEASQSNVSTVVQSKLDETVNKWEKIKPVLNLIVGQGDTNEIRKNLNIAIFFYYYGDTDSMVLYIEECKMALNKIIASNEPTITTIL